jgi:hypothetical protein
LETPSLIFLPFDSAFLGLKRFTYQGASEVIPSWIDQLDSLQTFSFAVKELKEISCDVCTMNSLEAFWIVSPYEKDKERYLRQSAVYPAIKRIKACKPTLQLWPDPRLIHTRDSVVL